MGIDSVAGEQYCYLTTVGRRTGALHTVEIWFGVEAGGKTLYILSSGGRRSDWVRNMEAMPEVEVKIGEGKFKGRGRIVDDKEEERLARRLVVAKYYGRSEVASSGWEAEALPVAIDLVKR